MIGLISHAELAANDRRDTPKCPEVVWEPVGQRPLGQQTQKALGLSLAKLARPARNWYGSHRHQPCADFSGQ
ncbi:MAG: hypothetical protein NTU53_22290 [Planctomycetota bacterium]|nr:hypothetical protein [Planctomycetota bacterium]